MGRPPGVGAAALVSVLMVLSACTPTSVATAPPTPSPAASVPIVAGTDAPGGPPFQTWTRIDLPDPEPDAYGGGTPSAVTAFDGGFLAVGTVLSCCDGLHLDESRGVLWTSGDGRSWTLHDHIATFDHSVLEGVHWDGGRLVVTGGVAASPTDNEHTVPAAWVSTDGVAWDRVPEPAPNYVVVSGSGLIGAAATYGDDFGVGTVCFVSSGDGLAWTDVSGGYAVALQSIASAPDGSAMALGTVPVPPRGDGSAATNVVAWRSTDGTGWDAPEVIVRGAVPIGLVHDGGGFVAIGNASTVVEGSMRADYQVWRFTADGHMDATRLPVAGEDAVGGVFAIGDVLIATGTGVAGLTTVLVSADGGATWARVSDEEALNGPETDLEDVIETPGGLLAVGWMWGGVSPHRVPEAWLSDR